MTTLAAIVAVTVAIPVVVLFVECLLSLVPFSKRDVSRPAGVRAVVLMPAHNESGAIVTTLEGIQSQLGPDDTILVIADNCTDDTAALASGAGATVVERTHAEHRGKGYALEFGIQHLDASPPDVVIIIDADCRLLSGTINALVAGAIEENRPLQAEYVFEPPNASPLTMVSALAALIRNKARPRGLLRIGQPCHLMGSGMAFPWQVLRDAPSTGDYLVEDLLMGIEMAMSGHPARHCVDGGVRSALPAAKGAAMSQRRRWEHGHLATLLQHGPRLLVAGLTRGSAGLVALGLDLMVPPLTLLVLLLLVVAAGAGAVAWQTGNFTSLYIVGGTLGLLGVSVSLSWLRFGAKSIPLRYLLAAPFYVLWKLPLYASFVLGRRQKEWQRTER